MGDGPAKLDQVSSRWPLDGPDGMHRADVTCEPLLNDPLRCRSAHAWQSQAQQPAKGTSP
jgi:hypothetical protein